MMVAIIGGIAVGIAIALNLVVWDDGEMSNALPKPLEQEEVLGRGAATDEPDSRTAAIAPERQGAAPGDETGDAARPIAPSFDVVRVNPGGSAVIAGRAEPGALVEIYEGDAFIGSVIADQRGEWVFVPAEPLRPGNRRISLRSRTGDDAPISSDRIVMIVVPEAETGLAADGGSRDTTLGEALANAEPALVLSLPSDGGAGTEVLQKPGSQLSTMLGVDAMDYDEHGEINLSGTATTESLVNV